MGDPSGIGPVIIPKAIKRLEGAADFLVIGDGWVLDKTGRHKEKTRNYRLMDLANVGRKDFSFGKANAQYGKASIEYLDKAIEFIENDKIDALVTCPISKEAVAKGGYNNFSGHTEYLARRTNAEYFAMMLLNRKLRVSLLTRHIPLEKVPSRLNADEIFKHVSLTAKSLKEVFLIREPRIAVCGLNPHASDNGLLGGEENRIIKPALERLRKRIKHIDGPLPADVAALKAVKGQYDCIIAMYHDQALIPLKVSDEHTGVNITLGLGFIRTSPLHGTAFDIASRFNLADPRPLAEAIRLCIKCASNLKNR